MKKRITLSIDRETLEKIKADANNQKRSVSQTANLALTKYYEGEK